MSRPEPVEHPLSIWIVNPFDDIPGEGLPPLRSWTLARILAARGHDVTWWTATWSHRRKKIRTPPIGIREDEGFAVRLVAVRPYEKNVSLARLGSHRDFGRTFERLANESIASGQLERPDLILASLPPLDSPEAAVRLAHRLDAELVVDLIDLWPETFERLLPLPAWLRKIALPFLVRSMRNRRNALITAADAVTAVSETYLDAVGLTLPAGCLPADTPTHVCPLGAYVQEFAAVPRPLPNDKTEAGSAAQPSLQCVYSGSLETGQDVETIVGAARQLSSAGTSVTIHVAGTGMLEPKLRAAAAAATGSCTITMHGLLDRTAYVRLLAACDVGLVLVKPETRVMVPGKACDYAAAGLALVNSLPGELERLIADASAGMQYTAGDPASLARAIKTFADDRRLLVDCRRAARRLAEGAFDRERLYNAFADWLQGLRRPETE
jgi:glycosyltransferase involved in cell wall biosynthesis